MNVIYIWGLRSSFDIAINLRTQRSGIESQWRRGLPPVHNDHGAYSASCKMVTGYFPEDKERPWRASVHSNLLVPLSWKSRAIRLLPLWAVRPVQSLSACTRVHFIFTFTFTSGKSTLWSFPDLQYLTRWQNLRDQFNLPFHFALKTSPCASPFRAQHTNRYATTAQKIPKFTIEEDLCTYFLMFIHWNMSVLRTAFL